MESDNRASVEAASEKTDSRFGESVHDSLGARLAVENQAGTTGKVADAPVVPLELCDFRVADADSSREPCLELSFSVKPIKGIVVHSGELSEAAQKLAVGGQIRKASGVVELEFPNDDRVVFDTRTGQVGVDSDDKYQKEVHFEDTPWQRTILTSDHDTRITVGSQSISSIERDGVMEIFPKSYSMQIGAEPRMPASEELLRKLSDRDRDDLKAELSRIDRSENFAHDSFVKSHGDKPSVVALAETTRDRGLFLEKAAQALPADEKNLDACAENQLRKSLRTMREQFGAGTPETRSYAMALQNLLESKDNSDQQEEIERLAFEAKRGGLMKDVVDNINESPGADFHSMDVERALVVRKSLISIHIAGGDSALRNFVDDVNKRLDSGVLVAPVGQGGPFHHGAIILTPEGATTYNGSFNVVPRPED